MPQSSHLHDAVWVRQLVEQIKIAGHPAQRLLTEAGIVPRSVNAEGARLPFDRIAVFFELAANATGDEFLGFHFGQSRDVRDAGLLGYVGLASPTLIDAIRTIGRYRRVFTDAVELDLSTVAESGSVHWELRSRPIVHKRQFLEFSVTNLVHSLRVLTGRNLVPEHVAFAHPRNTDTKEFERFFGCHVDFARERTLVKFKLSDLHVPLKTADHRLLDVLQVYCREVLARRGDAPVALIERVERAVVDRLASGEAKLDVVASELGMSKRTLSRRLAGLNTNFNDVVDDLRCELAKSYLRDSRLSLAKIAFLLGYSEVSSFNTAFKRWTGMTPGQVRAPRALR